jgi:hypothetical protein
MSSGALHDPANSRARRGHSDEAGTERVAKRLNDRLQRTVMDKVPRHIRQHAAAEPEGWADTSMNLIVSAVAMLCIVTACTRDAPVSGPLAISNEQVEAHAFLQCMDNDEYFPKNLVDKGKQILLRLSERIEREMPADEAALYALTHAATRQFNDLAEEFYNANSEIETSAAECIALDFEFVAKAYGFENTDLEELIATRDW